MKINGEKKLLILFLTQITQITKDSRKCFFIGIRVYYKINIYSEIIDMVCYNIFRGNMKKKIAVLTCGWSVYYIKDFLKGIQKAGDESNADIYVFVGYNHTEFSGYPNFTGFSIFSLINYEDYDGVIILSDLIGNIRILEKERLRILKAKIPAIAINHKLEGISCMRIDNYSGAYELMNHLIKQHGYKDFGYLGGKENSIDMSERYKAYRTALTDNNIPIDMNKVFTVADSGYPSGYNFINDYVKAGNKLPEVLVCANDLLALAVMKVAQERGLNVPNDIKVVGYDDIFFAKGLNPAITTVSSNAQIIGFEAGKRVLSDNFELQSLRLKSTPVFRQSCGCENQINNAQKLFTLDVVDELSKTEEFTTQMERIEEIFTEAGDMFTLLTNLDMYFGKYHTFEGDDFCIFMKSDWNSVLINSAESLPQNLNYGPQMQSIVSIHNSKKYSREIIQTRDLVTSNMHSEKPEIFIFFPIYNHSYVHGYIVTKNNYLLIDNHYGYTWTRTFGTSLERFRKQNMFKQMSQQYLKLSTKDALSGMLNRVGLEKLAKPFYAQNKKNGLTTVLFFVDINKMKTINDNYGHLHGDLAVKTIAAATMEIVPKNWLCIRYGGDEFLVVGNSKNYNGEDYCEQIKQRVAKKTSTMHLPYNLSASVGTLSVPPNSDLTLEQAVEKVDEIMYIQKQEFHKNN